MMTNEIERSLQTYGKRNSDNGKNECNKNMKIEVHGFDLYKNKPCRL